jgi:capsular polysaccharide biosynthesis protein
LEQAWPQNTDRQDFYYLEREARKLEEIAWSDSVLKVVADDHDTSVSELRDAKLFLSQPAEAGWHFYAEDQNRQRAAQIASTWAKAFAENAKKQIGASDGLNSLIRLEVTQSADLPMERAVSIGAYLLAGALTGMSLGGLGVLFVKPKPGGKRK